MIWQDISTSPLKCIELKVVTYGSNYAPYLATRCFVELAIPKKRRQCSFSRVVIG